MAYDLDDRKRHSYRTLDKSGLVFFQKSPFARKEQVNKSVKNIYIQCKTPANRYIYRWRN